MTLSIHAIDAVLAAAAGVGLFFFRARYGGATALSELREANDILAQRVDALRTENGQLRALVTELQARTDVALALAPLRDDFTRSDEKAARRHEQHMGVLELIAQRLGPEEETNHVP